MTIQGLAAFLRRHAPSAYQKRPVSSLRGKSLAVDLSIWLNAHYRVQQRVVVDETVATRRASVLDPPDSREVLSRVLRCFLSEIAYWLSHGVTPVIVFDGQRPALKERLSQERAAVRAKESQRISELREKYRADPLLFSDMEELVKLLGKHVETFSDAIALLKRALALIGVPSITAKGEAEQLCSMLTLDGLVAATLSTDSDNLVYGCPLLVSSVDKMTDELSVVIHEKVLEELRCDTGAFADACILSGCDYNEKLGGVGPKRALDLLRRHGSIEGVAAVRDLTKTRYSECKALFSRRHSLELLQDEIPSLELGEVSPLLSQLLREYGSENMEMRIRDSFGVHAAIESSLKISDLSQS